MILFMVYIRSFWVVTGGSGDGIAYWNAGFILFII